MNDHGLLDIGPYADDPRIAYILNDGVQARVAVAGGGVARRIRKPGEAGGELWLDFPPTGVGGAHPNVLSALRALIGEPRSALVHGLVTEFDVDQLRGMAAAIAEEGWSDTGTAFEVLRSALLAAGRVA
jgi:hypothetical protein